MDRIHLVCARGAYFCSLLLANLRQIPEWGTEVMCGSWNIKIITSFRCGNGVNTYELCAISSAKQKKSWRIPSKLKSARLTAQPCNWNVDSWATLIRCWTIFVDVISHLNSWGQWTTTLQRVFFAPSMPRRKYNAKEADIRTYNVRARMFASNKRHSTHRGTVKPMQPSMEQWMRTETPACSTSKNYIFLWTEANISS